MALDAASYPALWALFDAGGPRPEYVLPVLYSESGFESTVINSIGCAGVNQACSQLLASLGVTAQTYATWPASEQITKCLTPYMLNDKPLNSGTRVYQANFLPATLSTATTLDSVLATSPGAVYSANAGLDTTKAGVITVQDLANSVARSAATTAVQQAIAAAYALRPNLVPNDPVYGTDYGHAPNQVLGPTITWQTWAVVAGILVGGGCVAYYIAGLPPGRRLAALRG
jgi:hypothetical protein